MNWTGRILREDKRGAIDGRLPPILQRLGLENENWVDSVLNFQKYFFDAAGSVSSLEGKGKCAAIRAGCRAHWVD